MGYSVAGGRRGCCGVANFVSLVDWGTVDRIDKCVTPPPKEFTTSLCLLCLSSRRESLPISRLSLYPTRHHERSYDGELCCPFRAVDAHSVRPGEICFFVRVQ